MRHRHIRESRDFGDTPNGSYGDRLSRRERVPRNRLDLTLSVERLAVRLSKLALRLDADDPDRGWALDLATDLHAARLRQDAAHPRQTRT